MKANDLDARLIGAVQDGLPLTPAPFTQLAERTGIPEAILVERLRALVDDGTIKRFGIVVHHRALGYSANGMVVWDVPDERVSEAGATLAKVPYVTLCYRRPRRLPHWPYNLFCMIHGQDRAQVCAQIETLASLEVLHAVRHEVLFSTRRFKQRGARYVFDPVPNPTETSAPCPA